MPERLFDGSLRALTHADQAAFHDHLIRLTPQCRLARFAMIADDAFLRRYAQISFALDIEILGYFEEGVLRAAGELRPIDIDASAEIAFAVEQPLRRKGIGTALMQHTLQAARRRGIRRIYMNCLPTNAAMQMLARKFSTELAIEDGDVVGILRARPSIRRLQTNAATSAFSRLGNALFSIGRRWLQPV